MRKRLSKKIIIGIIIVVVLSPFLLYLLSFNGLSITYNKSIEFKNCRVEYDQYLFGQKKLWEAHYITNNDEFNNAQRKLALCLIDEYLINPQKNIGEKIIELSIEGSCVKPDFNNLDSLIENRNEILDSNIYIK